MVTVFIIHGAYGNPKENWFPWLKKELEIMGCKVFVPKFPTPKGQNLKNWLRIFSKYEKYIDENSVVVGHSIGPAFLLSIIEKRSKPIEAAFFVAGFTGKFTGKWSDPAFDKINKTIAERKFNWRKIRKNCRKFYVFQADNDPYVSSAKGRNLAKRLKTKLIIVKGAGHFNAKAGYTKFPLLLKMIEKEL